MIWIKNTLALALFIVAYCFLLLLVVTPPPT